MKSIYRRVVFLISMFLLLAGCTQSEQIGVLTPTKMAITQTALPVGTATEMPSSGRLQAKPTKTGLPTAIVMETPPVLRSETRIELPGVTLDHWTYYETPSAVWGLAFEDAKTLWIGLLYGQVFRVNMETGACTVFQFDEMFHATKIVSRMEFDQGMWVGAQIGGPVKQYYQGEWTEYPSRDIFAFTPYDVWAATSKNVYRIEGEAIESYAKPKGKPFSIAVASDGNLWLSLRTPDNGSITTSKGVWQFDGETWEIISELDDGPGRIYHLLTTPDGSIWAVDRASLISDDPGRIKKYNGQDWVIDVENEETIVPFIDFDGNLWGKWGQGKDYLRVLRFDGEKWVNTDLGDQVKDLVDSIEIQELGTIIFSPSGIVCLGTDIGVFCKERAQ